MSRDDIRSAASQSVRRRFLALSACLVLLCAFSEHARALTTGGIVGVVSDEGGAGLPGVTVEAKSAALQGSRATRTDGAGSYRLTFLPPGPYTLSFTLQDYRAESRSSVVVSLDKDTRLDIPLKRTVREEVSVVAEAPTVDTSSTTLGSNITSQTIETLPTGRNYSAIVQIVPGVSSDANPENKDQSSITVYGSAGNENSYFIDGVNTTNQEYGFQGKELNYEFIREIDVKTGGYEAEYGKSTGGIINVITKSGGNEFHGDLFGYYDDDGLQRNPEETVSTGGTVEGFQKRDYGADVGGYFVKDRLWFFGAFDRVTNTTRSALPAGPQAGGIVESQSRRKLGSAKLTWRLSDSHSLIATFFQDPREDTGAINDASHTLNGDPLTYGGKQDFGGRDYALRYEGILGSHWVVTAQAALHNEENSVGPASPDGDAIQFRNAADNFFQTGGFGLIQEKQFKRKFVGGSATLFLPGNEVKFGIEYEKEEAEVTKRESGGQQVDVFPNPVPLSAERFIYRHAYWTTPDATVANAPLSQLFASPEHKLTTLYLQDRWSLLSNLTVNAGLRWDRQEIIDAAGTKQIDLKDDYAPRLGIIWDPTRDGRTKVFGSFGRFYEQLPMDLVIRSFSFERQPRIINYDRTDNHPNPAAEADFGTPSTILGGFTEPSDPDLKGQYLKEFIVGGEREVLSDVTLGVKGIFRKYGEVIEDFLCKSDGTYCIGNPGHGIMDRIFTLDYSRTLPAPSPRRRYKGVQVDVRKRFSKNWEGMASYVWSKIEGNYDGEFAPFTNVGADPNISAAYDYYDFFTDGQNLGRITNDGPLSNDRRHQFKASGVYFTPFKLSIGVAAYFRTGTPVTRYGYSDAYGRYEFFLTPRGGEGRTPSSYEADLHLGYPLVVKRVTINFLLDVFNVLNRQKPVLLDQRWGFQESDNTLSKPANPDYLKPILRTPPTSVRIGMRVSY